MDDFTQRIGEEMPRLPRYALALLRSEIHADDLVQECVVRALSNNVRRSRRQGLSAPLTGRAHRSDRRSSRS